MRKIIFLFTLLFVLSACGTQNGESSMEQKEESSFAAAVSSEESEAPSPLADTGLDTLEKAFEPSNDGTLKAGMVSLVVPEGFKVNKVAQGSVTLTHPEEIARFEIAYLPISAELFGKTPEELVDESLNQSIVAYVAQGYTPGDTITTLDNQGLVVKTRSLTADNAQDSMVIGYAQNEEDQIMIQYIVEDAIIKSGGKTDLDTDKPYRELIGSLKSKGDYTLPDAANKVGEHPAEGDLYEGFLIKSEAPGELTAGNLYMNYPKDFTFTTDDPQSALLSNEATKQTISLIYSEFHGADPEEQAKQTIDMMVEVQESVGYEKFDERYPIEREGFTILEQKMLNNSESMLSLLTVILSDTEELALTFTIDLDTARELNMQPENLSEPTQRILDTLKTVE